MTPWKVLSTQTLLDRRWLKVHQQHVLLANGHEIREFHLLDSVDWAATLALTEDARVVMVEQYRHGMGGPSLELPAGALDDGEEPLAAAQRELLEETGYHAERWEALCQVSPEPSRSTHKAHFFLAWGARRLRKPAPEPSESIRVRLLATEAVREAAMSGAIRHGVHIGPILIAAQRGLLG